MNLPADDVRFKAELIAENLLPGSGCSFLRLMRENRYVRNPFDSSCVFSLFSCVFFSIVKLRISFFFSFVCKMEINCILGID